MTEIAYTPEPTIEELSPEEQELFRLSTNIWQLHKLAHNVFYQEDTWPVYQAALTGSSIWKDDPAFLPSPKREENTINLIKIFLGERWQYFNESNHHINEFVEAGVATSQDLVIAYAAHAKAEPPLVANFLYKQAVEKLTKSRDTLLALPNLIQFEPFKIKVYRNSGQFEIAPHQVDTAFLINRLNYILNEPE